MNADTDTTNQPFDVKREAAARKALAAFLPEQAQILTEAELLALDMSRAGATNVSHEMGVFALTLRAKLLLRPFIETVARDGKPGLPMIREMDTGEATLRTPSVCHRTDYVLGVLKVVKALEKPSKWKNDADKACRIDTRMDVMRIKTEDFLFLIAPRFTEA